jgi:sigma-B regulation protein RsbU (phosphoserine phosphatase)
MTTCNGPLLGLPVKLAFEEQSIHLAPGDTVVLYTDGVTEALNTDGDEFGLDRMIQSVRASATDGAQTIVKRIIEDVRSFTGSFPQNDDITVIAIRKT